VGALAFTFFRQRAGVKMTGRGGRENKNRQQTSDFVYASGYATGVGGVQKGDASVVLEKGVHGWIMS
jgi:hypothetical protein